MPLPAFRLSAQDPAEPDCEGRLVITHDETINMIRIHGYGFWSLAYVDMHFRELEDMMRLARRSPHPVKTLVDLREAPVQSHDVASRLHGLIRAMYRKDERVALVVASSLVKMQMRRGVDIQTHELFLSPSAAENWLRAWDKHH